MGVCEGCMRGVIRCNRGVVGGRGVPPCHMQVFIAGASNMRLLLSLKSHARTMQEGLLEIARHVIRCMWLPRVLRIGGGVPFT